MKKCRDTLDVWIDSGCSHVAVLDAHPELHCPADLYLEATDQHRGWFQSSLMLSVGYRGIAPYKTVMTHGFVVDKDKKKLSKSDAEKAGKPIDAAHFYNKYGADIVRLWVSSVDWQNEVPFGEDLFKQVAEPYRRLRNTLRILLGNLDGFDPIAIADLQPPNSPCSTAGSSNASTPSPPSASRPTKPTSSARSSTRSTTSAPTISPPSTSMRPRTGCIAMRRIPRAASPRRRRCMRSSPASPSCSRRSSPSPPTRHGNTPAFTSGSVHEQDFPEANPAFAPGEATQAGRPACSKSNTPSRPPSKRCIQAKEFTRNNEADVSLTIPESDAALLPLLNDRDFATEFFIIAGLNRHRGRGTHRHRPQDGPPALPALPET